MRTGWMTLALALAIAGLPRAGAADVVELRSGEWLLGHVAEESGGNVVLEHALLGRLELPAAEVVAVRLGEPVLPPAPAETAIAPLPEPPAEAQRPGLMGTGLMRGWERQIELGLNGSRGNSETMDVRAGLTAGYEDEERRWIFEAGYARAEDEKQLTDEAAFGQLVRDWLLPNSRRFYFSQARYDFDKFKDWDHRAAVSGGVGYQLLDDELWNLRLRSGLGLTRTFGSEDDSIVPEAVLGAELRRILAEGHQISAHTTFFPALDSLGEFRNLSGVEWEIRLRGTDPLGLKLGFENIYESETEGDSRRYDLNYYGALVYDF